MSILLETSLGDITIDLDIDQSPTLCHNVLKLAKARYYTNTLIYNVQPGRFCQMGDPVGDGSGGCSIYGLIDSTVTLSQKHKQKKHKVDVRKSQKRFLRSKGHGELTKEELCEKGRVIVTNMGNVKNTIGSQFLITVDSGPNRALDGIANDTAANGGSGGGDDGGNDSGQVEKKYYSLGHVTEDENDVLSQINNLYCDKSGRPYTDVRIIRMHVLDDPYNGDGNDGDPEGMDEVLEHRGVKLIDKNDLPEQYTICSNWISCSSPNYDKPDEETVEERIKYEDAMVDMYNEDGEVVMIDEEKERKRQQELLKKEDKSNAVILEMLGDIASADDKPPENVLFICKLNPMTEDEDLQLIFSRFDPNVKAEIVRDPDTGNSLQYAFVEFDTKEACTEAYFKMNNALIDDRRIRVDFSQSVSKEWNRFTQRKRGGGYRGAGGDGRGGNNFNYRDNRTKHHNKPKEEKKYYGGYKQQNHNNTANTLHSGGRDGDSDRFHSRSGKVGDSSSSINGEEKEVGKEITAMMKEDDEKEVYHRVKEVKVLGPPPLAQITEGAVVIQEIETLGGEEKVMIVKIIMIVIIRRESTNIEASTEVMIVMVIKIGRETDIIKKVARKSTNHHRQRGGGEAVVEIVRAAEEDIEVVAQVKINN
eukprot:CAMPEP_0203666574 /NCGR_PEP_ID=MMETSP0090-20130426/3578_1 /ASSEMBLY_ACC=CAM_ASM_001088 /TAXON_ID=426623 /ORGANISM="Chaetoceros affinis, Strain CCMP159" /LENGTH=645 /DNA_ID=CAMNT_0050530493 /DNA_START=148 /DNA_END=2086 /DNA_ORIENTATION=+